MLELKTALVGQIARILALYEVDEVIVFIDSGYEQAGDPEKVSETLQTGRLIGSVIDIFVYRYGFYSTNSVDILTVKYMGR